MTSKQAQGFLDGLGDLWFEKNLQDLGKTRLVGDLIDVAKIEPSAVLEVGCANGWQLKRLREKYGCAILGIDPSKKAIDAAGEPENFRVGLSTNIPLSDGAVDMVIMGFCLWATAPEDWFRTVAEVDRVLADHGHLIIHDYITPRFFRRLYASTEKGEEFFQYYYDWSKLWVSNPAYRVLGEMMHPGQHAVTCASVLRKDMAGALSVDFKG